MYHLSKKMSITITEFDKNFCIQLEATNGHLIGYSEQPLTMSREALLSINYTFFF